MAADARPGRPATQAADGRAALLVLDFQVGVADQPFATGALAAAVRAVARARAAGMDVIYSRIGFADDYADVPTWSPVFRQLAASRVFAPGTTRLVDALSPGPGEIVVEKDRFSPFAGSRLDGIVRSRGITQYVLAGLSTSGVVLATFAHAENLDVPVTVLEDACADPDDTLHAVLMERHFPRSATVTTVAEWQPA